MRYALRGKNICRNVFAKVLNVSDSSISNQSISVCPSVSFSSYSSQREKGRKYKLSAQSVITIGFLNRYAELNGMPCPRARGVSDEHVTRVLPSSTTYHNVYLTYKREWNNLAAEGLDCGFINSLPQHPQSFVQFRRVWTSHYSSLKIAPRGSDFYDYCTSKFNHSLSLSGNERIEVLDELNEHKSIAKSEFNSYIQLRDSVLNDSGGDILHLVFDYAEKVSLPSMIKQPGQLHFVTCLKFDLFGISVSN